MYINVFENDIFYQIFNMKRNKIVWNFLLKKFKDFPKDFFKNISPKVIIKAIKKETSVAHVIPFAPLRICPWFASTCLFNTIIPFFWNMKQHYFQHCFLFQNCMTYWSIVTHNITHDLWHFNINKWFIIDTQKCPSWGISTMGSLI